MLVWLSAAVWMLPGVGKSAAAEWTPPDATQATSSRAAREAAIGEIPMSRLTPEARQRIQRVVRNPSMFRRLPVQVVDCDPQLYRFLIRYPEVVVNIWQLMGITQVEAHRLAPYILQAKDGAGTTTRIELIYGTRDTHLIYCEGNYDGPLTRRPVEGRCVLLLKSGYVQTERGRWHVVNRLDVFLQVDHAGLDLLTRTVRPLIGKAADTNFQQSTQFIERIHRTSEENGPGMQRLASRLDEVSADVRDEFSRLTRDIFQSHQQRLVSLGTNGQPLQAPTHSEPTVADRRLQDRTSAD